MTGWLSPASSHPTELSDVPAECTLPGHTGFQSSLPGHASHGEPPVSLRIPAPTASPADEAVDTRDRCEHPWMSPEEQSPGQGPGGRGHAVCVHALMLPSELEGCVYKKASEP